MGNKYDAPRGQKTVTSAGGEWQAPQAEVAWPQEEAVTVGYLAAGAPLLVVPSLRGADGVDGTTASFLVKAAFRKMQKEKEEEEEEEEEARITVDLPHARAHSQRQLLEKEKEEEETSSRWHVLIVSCPSPAKQILLLSLPDWCAHTMVWYAARPWPLGLARAPQAS